MTKAKTINRLELTRKKFGQKMYGDSSAHFGEANEMIKPQHRQGYSTCPNCGQETLIHEDGCMHCKSCGWSACG